MTAVAIELNDAGVSVAAEGRLLGPPSPGYVLLDGSRLLAGAEALELARLRPRSVDSRFWDRLDTEPLRRPFPRHLSRADLAHAHLARLWRDIESRLPASPRDAFVLLAVPGSFSAHQMGLILSIARACGLRVTGMVDAALAAVAPAVRAGRALHLDVLLHRAVWTEFHCGVEVARQRVQASAAAGVAALHDAWARDIAERFVRQTRFDPLLEGSTEQMLYHRLPTWLERVGREEGGVAVLEAGGKERTIELSLAQLSAAARPIFDTIVEVGRALAAAGEPAVLLLSARAAGLPGLAQRLQEVARAEIRVLPEGAAAFGALAHREQIEARGSELPLVLRLAAAPAPADGEEEAVPVAERPVAERPAADRTVRSPTHLLHDGVAHPIGSEPLRLGVAIPAAARGINLTGATAGVSRSHCSVYRRGERVLVEDHSTYGTYLNGREIRGTAELKAGDRLRLGSPGIEIRLIAVEGTNG